MTLKSFINMQLGSDISTCILKLCYPLKTRYHLLVLVFVDKVRSHHLCDSFMSFFLWLYLFFVLGGAFFVSSRADLKTLHCPEPLM